MEPLFAAFGLSGAAARHFVGDAIRPMLIALDHAAMPLLAAGLENLDDLIDRETQQIADAMNITVPVRERDYFQASGGGWSS